MSTFRLYFRALLGHFFVKFSQNKIVMGKKILVPCFLVQYQKYGLSLYISREKGDHYYILNLFMGTFSWCTERMRCSNRDEGLCRRHRLGPKGPLRKRSSRSQLLRYPGNDKAPPFLGTVFCLPCLKNVFVEPVQNFALKNSNCITRN